MAQDRVQWLASVNVVMKILVPCKAEHFLELHGVNLLVRSFYSQWLN
jgi:hypothetical protein